jgi:hypothetical protein
MERRVLATRRALLLGAAACASGLEARADSVRLESLFVIARSKNRNVVHYAVRIRDSGRIDREEPVTAYWVMHAEDGRREGLSFLERRLAYGFVAEFVGKTQALSLRLQAFPARVLGVRQGARGRFAAHVTIAGQAARLERIFVATDERGITPSVRHLDLFGVSLAGGTSVTERILP